MLEALQNNTRLSLDPTIHSLRSYAAVQAFAKALEKSGTSDLSAVIETLKEVEMQDSAIGEFSFSESRDIWGLVIHFTKFAQRRRVSGLS